MKKIFKNIFHFVIAWISAIYYGCPSDKMIVIGVTGTKGKSSTCRFIASVLESGGYKVGMMTTVEFQIAEMREPNLKKMTMLGRGYIQKMLKKMVDAGCSYAVIETSSEGILQYRHVGINYDICVFTNLGKEHSERHGGFDNLRRDKARIFSGLTKKKRKYIKGQLIKKIIIANGDDDNAPYFLNNRADIKFTYSLKNLEFPDAVAIKGVILSEDAKSSQVSADKINFRVNIPGSFNVYNALAALAVSTSQDVSPEEIAEGIASVQRIAGRMEFIDEGQPYKVVVDYAHEPISLNELFSSLRKIVGHDHKIIGIIGSDGGGRDRGKRFLMGEISAKICDTIIVTDVNCFDEDPLEIAEMLASGARNAGKTDGVDLFIETDRRKAIAMAIDLLRPDDVVAITAKGTEPCIVVSNAKKIPWDDRKVVREILKEKGYSKEYEPG